MKTSLFNLPTVGPMMVREFTCEQGWCHFKDKVFMFQTEGEPSKIEVKEIGLADSRLDYDADVVDLSNGMFAFTSDILLRNIEKPARFALFTSCRWRTHRTGRQCEWIDKTFQFIGNPIIVDAFYDKEVGFNQAIVYRESSYLIKSGCQLQAEQEYA